MSCISTHYFLVGMGGGRGGCSVDLLYAKWMLALWYTIPLKIAYTFIYIYIDCCRHIVYMKAWLGVYNYHNKVAFPKYTKNAQKLNVYAYMYSVFLLTAGTYSAIYMSKIYVRQQYLLRRFLQFRLSEFNALT